MSLRFIDDEADEEVENSPNEDEYDRCIIAQDSDDDFDDEGEDVESAVGEDGGEDGGQLRLSSPHNTDIVSADTSTNVYADLQVEELISSLETRYTVHGNGQFQGMTSSENDIREAMPEDRQRLSDLLQPALSSIREQCSTGQVSVKEQVRRAGVANVYRVKCNRGSQKNVLRYFHSHQETSPEPSPFKVIAAFVLRQQAAWVYVALQANVFLASPDQLRDFLSQPEGVARGDPPRRSRRQDKPNWNSPTTAESKILPPSESDTAWNLSAPKGALHYDGKGTRSLDGRTGAIYERIATHELDDIWSHLEKDKPAPAFQTFQWVRITRPGPYFNDVGLIIYCDDSKTVEVLLIPRIEKQNLRPDEMPSNLNSVLNPSLPLTTYPQGPIPYNVILRWEKKFKLKFKPASDSACSMYWKGQLRFTKNGLQICTFNLKYLDTVTRKGNPVSLTPTQVEWFKRNLEDLGFYEGYCPSRIEPEIEFREGDRVGRMVGDIRYDATEDVYLIYCGILEGPREEGIWTYRTDEGALGEIPQSEMARWFDVGEYVVSALTKKTGLIVSISAQGVALIMARNLTQEQFEEEKESRASIGHTIMRDIAELQEADLQQKLAHDRRQNVGLSKGLSCEFETFEDHTNNLAPALAPNYMFSELSSSVARRQGQYDKLIPWIGIWVFPHKGLNKGIVHSIRHVQINPSSQPSGIQVTLRSELGGKSDGVESTVDFSVLRDWKTGNFIDIAHPLPPRLRAYSPNSEYLKSRKPISKRLLSRKRKHSPTPPPRTQTPPPSPPVPSTSSAALTAHPPLQYLLDKRLWGKKIMLKVPGSGEPTACWSQYDHSKCQAVIGRIYRSNWREETLRLLKPIHPNAKYNKKPWIIVKGENTGQYCRHIQQNAFSPSHSVRLVNIVEGRQVDTGVDLENVSAEDMNVAWDDPLQKEYNEKLNFHVSLRKNKKPRT